MPGLWSLTCSSVAAMSISFTPVGTKHWVQLRQNTVNCWTTSVNTQTQTQKTHFTFSHAVQHHVNQDVSPRPASSITAGFNTTSTSWEIYTGGGAGVVIVPWENNIKGSICVLCRGVTCSAQWWDKIVLGNICSPSWRHTHTKRRDTMHLDI